MKFPRRIDFPQPGVWNSPATGGTRSGTTLDLRPLFHSINLLASTGKTPENTRLRLMFLVNISKLLAIIDSGQWQTGPHGSALELNHWDQVTVWRLRMQN